MYNWRKLKPEARALLLRERKAYKRPWHAPPHFDYEGEKDFIVTAACFEHADIIGKSPERIAECEEELLGIAIELECRPYAWCIFPNHYHLLIRTAAIRDLIARLGKFHGSSSFRRNGEDHQRGWKVWYRCIEHPIRSDRHFYATLNYIHNNPVKHRYVEKWLDWPYSSAANYLVEVGRDEAIQVWKEFPVLDYGKEWDRD
jgi:putative transposase